MLIDCRTGMVVARYKFDHQYEPTPVRDWRSWPACTTLGDIWSNAANIDWASADFSPDDRFLSIHSYGMRQGKRSNSVTLIELATGQQETWRGEPEQEQVWPEVKFDSDGAKVLVNDKVVAKLESPGAASPATPTPTRFEAKLPKSKLWAPEWPDTFETEYKLVAIDFRTQTEDGDLSAVRVGPNGESSLVLDNWGRFYPILLDVKTGERSQVQFPQDTNSDFGVEKIAPRSYFAIGRQSSTPHDRLGSKEEFACWSIKTGERFALPTWSSVPLNVAWRLQIREFNGKLLVSEGNSHLTWVDTKTRATSDVNQPWNLGFGRELLLVVWCIAWFWVTRNAAENDHSRRLGYFLAAITILALLPPTISTWGLLEWSSRAQWLFAIGCLTPLAVGVFTCAVRRTASLPLITSAAVLTSLLIVAWIYQGYTIDWNTTWFGKVELVIKHDLDKDDVDFFRPWRFGAPKPDDSVHFEFRENLQASEAKP